MQINPLLAASGVDVNQKAGYGQKTWIFPWPVAYRSVIFGEWNSDPVHQDSLDLPVVWRLPQNSSLCMVQEPTSVLATNPGDRSPGPAMGPAQVSGLCTGCAGAQEPRERRYCYTVTSLINTLLTLSLSFFGS